MENSVLWEKIEQARLRDSEEIEIIDTDGKKIRVRISKPNWDKDMY